MHLRKKNLAKRSFSHVVEAVRLTAKQSCFADIIQHKQHQKSQLQTILKAVEEWKALELYNCKKLADIASPLAQIDRTLCQTTYELYDNLKQTLSTLSTQAKALAMKFQDDILIQLRQLCKSLGVQVKATVEKEKQEKKQLMNKKNMMEKVHLNYFNCRKSMEESQILNIVIATSVESTLDKRLKQSQKTLEAQKEFKLQEFKYQQTVIEYNQAVSGYRETLVSLLLGLETQEDVTIRVLRETCLKINLHSASRLKTVLHETAKLGDQVANFDVQECLALTIEQLTGDPESSRTQDLEHVTYTPYIGFLTITIQNIFERKLQGIIKYAKSREPKVLIEKAMRSGSEEELAGIVEDKPILNLLTHFIKQTRTQQTTSESQEAFVESLASVESRVNFISCMQLYRILGKCSMDLAHVNSLYKLASTFLDVCLDQKDSFHAKQLMALLFTYYSVYESQPSVVSQCDNNNNPNSGSTNISNGEQLQQSVITTNANSEPVKHKIYLQHFLRHHPIWHIREFWESALLECIYEEKRNNLRLSVATMDKEQEVEADKNAAFNQLACLTHNMILFGLPDKQTRQFAIKYTKLFNIPKESVEDIQKNIDSALEEYRLTIDNAAVQAIVTPYLNNTYTY